jgi:hypothetical protein
VVKKLKLFVLMAGRYDIVQGAKIKIHLDAEKNLYIASCDQKDFGIVKFIKDGSKKDLEKLGADFSGIVLDTNLDEYLMEVAVKKHGNAA